MSNNFRAVRPKRDRNFSDYGVAAPGHLTGGCKPESSESAERSALRHEQRGNMRAIGRVAVGCVVISQAAIVIVPDGFVKPRSETNVGSAVCRASRAARAGRTSPIVLGRVDAAGARLGGVESTNVGDANFAAQQIVEMDVDLGRSVDRYVHVFIADYVVRNDGAANRRAAIAAIDIDTHAARRGRVECIGEVSGNEVADDHVCVHVIRGSAEGRADVGVESNTPESITGQLVVDDHIIRGAAGTNAIGKEADSRATNLHAIVLGNVFGHGVVVNPIVGRPNRAHRRMRGKNDAALQRIVLDGVVDEQIVAAFRGLVADEDAVGIAGDSVAGHCGVYRSDEVKCATAITGFIGLEGRLSRAAGSLPREQQA
jgi:hypothetical protein